MGPFGGEALRASVVPGVGRVARDEWTRLFPGEAEGWDYYVACEAAPPPGFVLEAALVRAGDRIVAAAPTFRLKYRLDTPLQGRSQAIANWFYGRLPGLLTLEVMALGSPVSDHCHLGFAADLTLDERKLAMDALLIAIDAHARREGISVLVVKDLDAEQLDIADPVLQAARFTRVPSLPVAVLDLPFATEDAYFATLSAATRKDIRRKLRRVDEIRVEMRSGLSGVENELASLFERTRAESRLDYGDFNALSPAYFSEVLKRMGDRAVLFLYWRGDQLLGFNLLFVENDRLIDKVIGMRYPEGRQNNLWTVSWMTNVRYCLEHGIGCLESGRLAYVGKVRFGSALQKSWLYFKHRSPGMNSLFRLLGPLAAFDKNNPELDAVARRQAAKQGPSGRARDGVKSQE